LHREAQSRHEIIVGSHLEGSRALVGVLVHAELVVEEFLGQRLGLFRPRKMKAPTLKQRLEPGDQKRLALAHPHLSPLDGRRPRSPWVK